METILIVDDQPAICYSLKKLLESKGFIVFTALTGRKAIEILKQQKIDVTIIDLKMPDMDGLELLKTIKKENINVYSIMMTAFTTTDKAIEAIRLGAYDYLTKPIDNDELIRIINDIIKVKNFTMSTVSFGNLPSATDEDKIIGDSPKMLEIYKTIGRIAPTDVTVLIRGESGTGKELIAKAIYHYSKRSTMPFLAVNCAAIPESLLESELFGYERGAFTGAEIRKIGKLERCHRG
ncbi:MAG: sigma 54-interacting transcriptional regulator, partial [Thermodesulfovibrionales bacterium]|nr:sigma 54-interacting transcriptional regulator [Thermodesulfovibrionales bacterium]